MTKIFPNRLHTFPKCTNEIYVMGVKSRKLKYFLFRKLKGKYYTFTDFEIYIKYLCKQYDYPNYEFFTRKEMYRALQCGRYRDYEDFPFEYFSKKWEQVKPDEV